MLTVFSQMPNYCTVCGLSKAKDPSLSLYRIPKEPELRRIWLESLSLTDDKICAESRVCSRHFRDGNPKNIPSLHIGKSFSDRPTDETVRGKRRASRELLKHKRQSEPPLLLTLGPKGSFWYSRCACQPSSLVAAILRGGEGSSSEGWRLLFITGERAKTIIIYSTLTTAPLGVHTPNYGLFPRNAISVVVLI